MIGVYEMNSSAAIESATRIPLNQDADRSNSGHQQQHQHSQQQQHSAFQQMHSTTNYGGHLSMTSQPNQVMVLEAQNNSTNNSASANTSSASISRSSSSSDNSVKQHASDHLLTSVSIPTGRGPFGV